MKAIIMAGGEGSRLRPLTCTCPKPMLRLLDRPLMQLAIELLKQNGISQIGATLGYMPDSIRDYFGDGSDFGAELRYYIESTPLGTAGSVGQARDFLDERFIVLSGDGVCDFDLRAAVAFHEAHGAKATLLLVRSHTPQEYGMVVTDGDGRITAFHEKPGRSDIYSDLVNTGVYILEPEVLSRIPEGQPCDFGHELFPAMLHDGEALYGCIAEGYWCDVGNTAAYLRVHRDALHGRIALAGLAPSTSGARLEDGCIVADTAFIAPGAIVHRGAYVGEDCCIGPGCEIMPGASLKRSVLLRGAHIMECAQLRGCVVASGAQIGAGAQLFEESVVGAGSLIGDRAMLPPGVMVWPEKALPGGERAPENIVWGRRRTQRFRDGRLQPESPAEASRAAEACVAYLKNADILIGRSSATAAEALWHAAASGAMAQGARVIDAGVCALPQLRWLLAQLRPQAAMLICPGELLMLDSSGAPLTERAQREILKMLERQDFARPFAGITRPMVEVGRTDLGYVAETASAFTADPTYAPPVMLCCADAALLELARACFERAGLNPRCEAVAESCAPTADEIGILLQCDGERADISDVNGALSEAQLELARAWTALELGETRLIMPAGGTRAVEAIAAAHGAEVRYMPSERAAWLGTLAEKAPRQFKLHTDGVYFALAMLSQLAERGLSLAQWRTHMPAAFRSQARVAAPQAENGRLLHALAERGEAELGGGVRLKRGDGWAFLLPDEAQSEICLFAEAPTMETADEICAFYGREIERLLQKQD